jgi:protein-tyrosine-phosphatase
VSWYSPRLKTSLALVERAARDHSSSIIDVGGGESTPVDDLLARGYENITVLDVSQTAIDVTKKRLGLAAERIHWLVADPNGQSAETVRKIRDEIRKRVADMATERGWLVDR